MTREEVLISDAICASLSDEVRIETHYDQFLFHPEDVPMDIESIPQVFTAFRKKCEKYSKVQRCFEKPIPLASNSLLDTITAIPDLCDFDCSPFETHSHSAFPFK